MVTTTVYFVELSTALSTSPRSSPPPYVLLTLFESCSLSYETNFCFQVLSKLDISTQLEYSNVQN